MLTPQSETITTEKHVFFDLIKKMLTLTETHQGDVHQMVFVFAPPCFSRAVHNMEWILLSCYISFDNATLMVIKLYLWGSEKLIMIKTCCWSCENHLWINFKKPWQQIYNKSKDKTNLLDMVDTEQCFVVTKLCGLWMTNESLCFWNNKPEGESTQNIFLGELATTGWNWFPLQIMLLQWARLSPWHLTKWI